MLPSSVVYCLLLHSVHSFVVCSPRCKSVLIFQLNLLMCQSNKNVKEISVLHSVSSKLTSSKFFSSQWWKPALAKDWCSCHWHFLVKQGFPFKYFPAASNRIVLIDCIPVRQAFAFPLPTFPLGEFYFIYEKINKSKKRKAWDREFLWKIKQLLMQFKLDL